MFRKTSNLPTNLREGVCPWVRLLKRTPCRAFFLPFFTDFSYRNPWKASSGITHLKFTFKSIYEFLIFPTLRISESYIKIQINLRAVKAFIIFFEARQRSMKIVSYFSWGGANIIIYRTRIES